MVLASQSFVWSAVCGEMSTFSMRQNGWSGGSGSCSKTSRAAPLRRTLIEGGQQRRLVHDLSAADVHEDRPRAHRPQHTVPDEVVRLLGEGRGHHDVVHARHHVQDPVRGHDFVRDRIGPPRAAQTHDARAKGSDHGRTGAADVAQAHDPHRLSPQRTRLVVRPLRELLVAQKQTRALQEEEEAEDRELRERGAEHTARVRHRDRALDEVREEQVVHARRPRVDPAQARGGPPDPLEGRRIAGGDEHGVGLGARASASSTLCATRARVPLGMRGRAGRPGSLGRRKTRMFRSGMSAESSRGNRSRSRSAAPLRCGIVRTMTRRDR
jgi:hypothetical protein